TGGCSDVTATRTVTVTAPPSAGTLSGTQAICTGGSSTFSSTVSGGSWSSGTPSVATINASTGVISGLTAGTSIMTYTVTGTGGCADATATRTVTVTTAPSVGTLSGTQGICVGGNTTFSSTVSGGSWSSGTPAVATINASTGAVSGLTAGTSIMTYTVTGTGGCSNATATRTVTVTAAPSTGTLSGTQAICVGSGTSFTSTVSGGTWSSGTPSVATVNASSGAITGLTAGTSIITYTVTGSGGCADATATRTVTVTAAPSAGTLSGTQAICTGGSTTFSSSVSGGVWSSANGVIASVNSTTGVISGLSAGTTTITYTVSGSGGCADATATRTVTVTAAPSAGTLSGSQAICVGGSTTFSSTVAGGAWSSGTPSVATINASTGAISGLAAGSSVMTYTVTGTGGCSNVTATRTVTVTAAPSAGTLSGLQTICAGSGTTFSSTISGGTWSSSNTAVATVNSSTGDISGLTAGSSTITYTVAGTGGCSNATATRTVTVQAVSAVPVITGTYCSGGSTISGSGINGSVIYVTSGSASSIGTVTVAGGTWTATMSAALVAGDVITAYQTESGKCISAASATATVGTTPAAPTLGTITQPNCTVSTGSVALTGLPSSGSWTVTGTPSGSAVSSGTSTTISSLPANTTYTFTVTAAGCTSPASANAVINPVPAAPATPVASVTAQPTCSVPSGTIVVSSPTGVQYEYQLDAGSFQSSATFTGVASGSHTIKARLAASTDCVSPPSGTITVNATPTALVTNPVTICQGGSGNLTVDPGSVCVQNFVIPSIPGPNLIYGGWLSGGATANTPSGAVNSTVCSFTGPSRTYSVIQFQVSATGNYIFEMNTNSTYNGAGYIVTGNFTPGSCSGGSLIRVDNASGTGGEPKLGSVGSPMTLYAGLTYSLVSTTDGAADVVGNDYTWTVTPPAGENILLNQPGTVEWYTASSGGSPIGSGATFNPVGVAGSGLANTNSQGTYTFWAACSSSPSCRTQADFIISSNVTIHTVTPGGSSCYNASTPVSVGLSNSTAGLPYQLMRDGVAVGSSVTSSGGAITIGNTIGAGIYTVNVTSGSCSVPMSGFVEIKPVPAANAGSDATINCGSNVVLTATSNSTTISTETFGTGINTEITDVTSGWRIKYLYGSHPNNRSEWWITYNGANPYSSNMENAVNNITSGSGLTMLDHRIYQTIVPGDYAWDAGTLDEIAYNTSPVDAQLYTSVNVSFNYQVGGTYSGSNVYDYLQVMYSLD
ncbi:MAG TPA: hypothetical protein VK174_15470, partial [Chitinophagales bacterium]|nr:hypothetical protein [Chitinophagales bacterium]